MYIDQHWDGGCIILHLASVDLGNHTVESECMFYN